MGTWIGGSLLHTSSYGFGNRRGGHNGHELCDDENSFHDAGNLIVDFRKRSVSTKELVHWLTVTNLRRCPHLYRHPKSSMLARNQDRPRDVTVRTLPCIPGCGQLDFKMVDIMLFLRVQR